MGRLESFAKTTGTMRWCETSFRDGDIHWNWITSNREVRWNGSIRQQNDVLHRNLPHMRHQTMTRRYQQHIPYTDSRWRETFLSGWEGTVGRVNPLIDCTLVLADRTASMTACYAFQNLKSNAFNDIHRDIIPQFTKVSHFYLQFLVQLTCPHFSTEINPYPHHIFLFLNTWP